jgi:3-hydroxyisobutyrate dehydrogenase-like beta-hydroxyacid dehydrogenase
MRRIGFIGLGLMGQPMSRRLLEAGYPLTVWNRTREKAAPQLALGAAWADSPGAVSQAADIVITMVTDSAASEAVICGEHGVLEGAHAGLTLIDMSSIAPEVSRAIAAQAKARGVLMLDAPVTGAPKAASEGKLGVMVGGPRDVFEGCRPVFDAFAAKVVYAGDNGMGTTLKLVNNLILGITIHAAAEALVLATKAGLDPQVVIDITSVGGARTGAMETRGPRMVRRDFTSHFSANNMYKDLSTALKLAEECGVSLPVGSAAREVLRVVRAQGKGDLDSCAVLTVLEAMANTVVRAKA